MELPKKCPKCGGSIPPKNTLIALTGNECKCNVEINLKHPKAF